MFNSIDRCQPLCLPFACVETDSVACPLRPEPFAHYYAEMLLLLEGDMAVTVEGEEMRLSPGEAVMICPGAPHAGRVAGEGPVRFALLLADPDQMPRAPVYAPDLRTLLQAARRAGVSMKISREEAEELRLGEIAADCVQECRERAFGYETEVISRLAVIFGGIIRLWFSRGLKPPERESREDPLYTITGYIREHLRESLRVEDLAASCGLSYPWFAKKFREIYGVSCKDYIEQVRVARVEQYLRFTQMDLTRISHQTGYADCSHMIKNFKQIMGITPGQYRMKLKAR